MNSTNATMLAVTVSNGQLLVDHKRRAPVRHKNEALVRVALAGICSTDLEIIKGYFGFEGILGHEFVGQVAQCDQPQWLGKRVVASINFADAMSPEYSEFGFEHHPHRQVLGIHNRDGAMAQWVCIPVANLYEVPEDLSDRRAVFTEPVAAALRIAVQLRVSSAWRVCVIGPGRLGMLVAHLLALGGADVVVAGRHDSSLQLAADWGLQSSLVSDLPSSHFHLVVEATGNAEGLSQAIRVARPLSTIVLKSTYAARTDVDLTKIVVDEIRLQGSRCGPFAPALRLLSRGTIPVESLIDAEYAASEAAAAFEYAARPGVRKVLLKFN